MIPRRMEPALREYASLFRVVTVTGPRQSGKTTLVKQAFPEKQYLSLEDPDVQRLASTDARALLDSALTRGKGVILDEIQRVPELLSYIQGIVDRDRLSGQFILTGSQNLALLERVTQTLAGRSGILHLLPLSAEERASAQQPLGDPGEAMLLGGYPSLLDWQGEPNVWLRSYIETYVERDVRQVLNVADLNSFRSFIRLCAGRVGQLLDLTSLATDCGVATNTAKRWLSVMESCYLVARLQPLHTNFGKRLIKTPKLYFVDSGVAASLLGIRTRDELLFSALRGQLFETWVYSELLKGFQNRGLSQQLMFWRDRQGLEVDFAIEQPDGIVAVEVKSGTTMHHEFLAGLRAVNDLGKQAIARRFLIYGGTQQYETEGITVLPWNLVDQVFTAIR